MATTRKNMKLRIINQARSFGADLIGFAPVSRWAEYGEVKPPYRPEAIWPKVKTVIVMGIPMLLPIIETTPSINYTVQYDTSNILLDQIAYRLAVYLNGQGYASIFSPRDGYGNLEILLDNYMASFSQVFAARYAGLGTIGYSHNLLNPKYGPRVRYVSVFTELELPGDPVIGTDLCNKCLVCHKRCPSKAFTTRNASLIADMDVDACTIHHQELVKESRWPCGICAKVCPVGEDRKLYDSQDIKLYLDEQKALEINPDDPRYQKWVHVRKHGSKGNRIF